MDTLPDSLLLKILSHLDDSADVARCRVASKAFNAVFPDLPSIHLHCSLKWYLNLTSRVSFKTVFLHLISKLKVVESVRVTIEDSSSVHADDIENGDFYLTDGDFAMEWLPRVSDSLKSLALFDLPLHPRPSNILPLISACCRNLLDLEIRGTWLSVDNLDPMPMLTNLTLKSTILEDRHLKELNKCFPNLQSLQLISVEGLINPKIHHLNLENFACYGCPSLTLRAPRLICLTIFGLKFIPLRLEAPMLSSLFLSLGISDNAGAFTFSTKKFENLTTVVLNSSCIGSMLSVFPITKTVKNLRLDSRNQVPLPGDPKMTLRKVFTIFPNVSFLSIMQLAWSELEECTLNRAGWDILDGKKGLKTLCVHLKLVDPLLTFSSLSFVLDECVGLSDVSLLIHKEVADSVSKSFMSKCMARWPGLKWKWRTWG